MSNRVAQTGNFDGEVELLFPRGDQLQQSHVSYLVTISIHKTVRCTIQAKNNNEQTGRIEEAEEEEEDEDEEEEEEERKKKIGKLKSQLNIKNHVRTRQSREKRRREHRPASLTI